MDKIRINQAHITDVKELSINGTTVTSTAAELNAMDNAALVSMDTVTSPDSGTCRVQLTFKDAAGDQCCSTIAGILYISEDAAGLTHDTAPSDLAGDTDGSLTQLAADNVALFTSTTAGLLGLTITAAADDYYVAIVLPNGKVLVSTVCTVNA